MASTPLGDIPGARFHVANIVNIASVASGGANGILGFFGPFAHNIRMRNAWFIPTGANVAATQTATFRRLSIFNGGPAGTVVATANRIASLNLTASSASFTPIPFTIVDPTGTTETVASGNMCFFSQETQGGTDANGTVLPAGQFALAYEVV